MTRRRKRLGLLMALSFALLPILGTWAGDAKSGSKNQFFKGTVVSIAEILAKDNTKIDPDAAPYWLALQTEDGKLYPLVMDSGSRMFFKDAKLLKRPMRLTARLIPNAQMLQVINVHSLVKGKLYEVYYWCDICTIKRYEAGICDCCGAPLDFREEPWQGN